MTEEQRFRLAAKACGKDLTGFGWNSLLNCFVFLGGDDPLITWNPLDDDGDSRRLEVSLMIDLVQEIGCVCAITRTGINSLIRFEDESERAHATRTALLNCAVAIGRAMGC